MATLGLHYQMKALASLLGLCSEVSPVHTLSLFTIAILNQASASESCFVVIFSHTESTCPPFLLLMSALKDRSGEED